MNNSNDNGSAVPRMSRGPGLYKENIDSHLNTISSSSSLRELRTNAWAEARVSYNWPKVTALSGQSWDVNLGMTPFPKPLYLVSRSLLIMSSVPCSQQHTTCPPEARYLTVVILKFIMTLKVWVIVSPLCTSISCLWSQQENSRVRVGTCVHPEVHAHCNVSECCHLLQPQAYWHRKSELEKRPAGWHGSLPLFGTGRNWKTPQCWTTGTAELVRHGSH